MWEVVLLEEVEDWYLGLGEHDRELVGSAIERLATLGPQLGRPLVDRIEGARHHNMKELRPGSTGRSAVRVLFCFDPQRQAVLLVAGDKAGQWNDWYTHAIPLADDRYDRWLAGDYDEERT